MTENKYYVTQYKMGLTNTSTIYSINDDGSINKDLILEYSFCPSLLGELESYLELLDTPVKIMEATERPYYFDTRWTLSFCVKTKYKNMIEDFIRKVAGEQVEVSLLTYAPSSLSNLIIPNGTSISSGVYTTTTSNGAYLIYK